MSETTLLQFGCPQLEPLRHAILKVTPDEKAVPSAIVADIASTLAKTLPDDAVRRGAILGLAEGYAAGFFETHSGNAESFHMPDAAYAKDVAIADMVPFLTQAIALVTPCHSANLLAVMRAMASRMQDGSEELKARAHWLSAGKIIGAFDRGIMRGQLRHDLERDGMDIEEFFPWPLVKTATGNKNLTKYIGLDGKTVISVDTAVDNKAIWSHAGTEHVVEFQNEVQPTIRYEREMPVRWYVGNITPAPSRTHIYLIDKQMVWIGLLSP